MMLYLSLIMSVAAHAPARDVPNIRGVWVTTATETEGKPVARDKLAELKVVIGDGRLEYVYVRKPDEPNLAFTLELDPTANPKRLTMTPVGGAKATPVLGIYSLDAGTLRICFADGEGRDNPDRRPKDFTTAPGTRQVLMTLKRDPVGDPDRVMRAMDGFRKKLPEPQGLNEMNGLGVADIEGKTHPDSHLKGIATRLGATTRAECMALMTYLKDPDPKIRRIAAFALEGLVKAYPNGMSSDDIQKVDSDGHRKMVAAFIAGIEKLPK
jgi:uncharacterized protein (TIGR03067 family)